VVCRSASRMLCAANELSATIIKRFILVSFQEPCRTANVYRRGRLVKPEVPSKDSGFTAKENLLSPKR
jgi:hypothetical protein